MHGRTHAKLSSVAVQRLVNIDNSGPCTGPVYRPRNTIKNTFSAEFEMDPSLMICPKQIYLTICVVRIKSYLLKTSDF